MLHAIERGVELNDLALDEMRGFSKLIDEDVFEALSLEQTLSTKSLVGGTAPDRVREALEIARQSIKAEE